MRLSPGLPRLRLPAQPSLWQCFLRRREARVVRPAVLVWMRVERYQVEPCSLRRHGNGLPMLKVRLRTASWQLHRSECGLLAVLRWLLRSECRCAQDDGESAVYWGCFGLALDVGSVALRNILHTQQMWMTYFMARSPGHVKGPADAARGFPVYVSPLFRGSMLPKTLWKSEAMAVRPLKPAAACSLDQWSYSSTPLMAAFYPRCEGAMCPDYQGPCGWALNSCWCAVRYKPLCRMQKKNTVCIYIHLYSCRWGLAHLIESACWWSSSRGSTLWSMFAPGQFSTPSKNVKQPEYNRIDSFVGGCISYIGDRLWPPTPVPSVTISYLYLCSICT